MNIPSLKGISLLNKLDLGQMHWTALFQGKGRIWTNCLSKPTVTWYFIYSPIYIYVYMYTYLVYKQRQTYKPKIKMFYLSLNFPLPFSCYTLYIRYNKHWPKFHLKLLFILYPCWKARENTNLKYKIYIYKHGKIMCFLSYSHLLPFWI